MHTQPKQYRKSRVGIPTPGRAAGWSRIGRLLIGSVVLLAGPAHAIWIELIDVGTNPMSPTQLAAFQQAAHIWEQRFIDFPLHIKINIAWENGATICLNDPNPDCPIAVIAATRSTRTSPAWSVARNALLVNTAPNSTERAAVMQLPTGTIPIVDIHGPRNADKVSITTANAKALFLAAPLDTVYGNLANNADAQILYNNYFVNDFDFDRSGGISAGKLDFVGVAAHEIGHALGFTSLTDIQDLNPLNDGMIHENPDTHMDQFYPELYPNLLDIWRFDDDMVGGVNAHALSTEARWVTAGPAEYYDSGYGFFFSWGILANDPSHCQALNPKTFQWECQASHTRDDLNDLMDPTAPDGVLIDVHADDQHALDYLGYSGWQIHVNMISWATLNQFVIYDPVSNPTPPSPFPGSTFPPVPATDPGAANVAIAGNVKFNANPKTGEISFGDERSMWVTATFHPATAISVAPVSLPFQDGQSEWLGPPPTPVTTIPPQLCDVHAVTDDQNGPQLSGSPPGGEQTCLSYDSTINGWRIPLFMDGCCYDNDPAAIMVFNLTLENQPPTDGLTLDWLTQNQGAVFDPTATDDNVLQDRDPERTLNTDSDGDGIANLGDNCIETPNPDQWDSDKDNFGNACDCDFNNDNFCGGPDFTMFINCFNKSTEENPDCDAEDMNHDGLVAGPDFTLFIGGFNNPPGPSAL